MGAHIRFGVFVSKGRQKLLVLAEQIVPEGYHAITTDLKEKQLLLPFV